MVLPSGADPSTEQQTKGADPRTGSLKMKRPVVLSGLAVWVLVLVLCFRLAPAGRSGSGLALGLPLWALSWCLLGPLLVPFCRSWPCSGFGFF